MLLAATFWYLLTFSAHADTTSAHQRANEAYARYEESLQFACEQIGEVWKNSPATWSAETFSGASSLDSTRAKFEIAFSIGRNNNSDLKYAIRLGDAEALFGNMKGPRLLLPPAIQVSDPATRATYKKLLANGLRCNLRVQNDIVFQPEDYNSLVHLVVHPHRYYELSEKLSPVMNEITGRPNVKTYVLLENARGRQKHEIISGAPPINVDPELTVAPGPNSEFRVAPNGVIDFSGISGKLPANYVMTGGWFNACMTHVLDSLFSAFQRSSSSSLSIAFPLNGVQVQADGQDKLDTFPGMSSETTLAELKAARPKVFQRFIVLAAEYHLKNWQAYELSKAKSTRGLRVTWTDERGRIVVEKTWGEKLPSVAAISFKLL